MKTKTPHDPHAERDEWLTVEEVCRVYLTS
jgi:hypothetical protein